VGCAEGLFAGNVNHAAKVANPPHRSLIFGSFG
jgi:hypothetical protein